MARAAIKNASSSRKTRSVPASGLAPPPFQPVQLATLVDTVPTRSKWRHEMKYDGYRLLVAVGNGSARAMPASWLLPERMAARSLRLPMWEGGQRSMRASSPDAFANVAAGDRIITADRETIKGCSKAAVKADEPVRCTIRVGR